MNGGLAPPEVKIDVQVGVVLLHVGNGDLNDLVPQSAQAPVAFLKPVGVGHRLGIVLWIFF